MEATSEPSKQWPSSDWKEAFHTSATPEACAAALRVARLEVARLHRLGLVGGGMEARDLVQQVLHATIEGTRRWDPTACTLTRHLCDGVRHVARGFADPRRHRPAGTVALDHLSEEDPAWQDAALAADGERAAVVADLARRVESELWARAAADPVALRVLVALSAGVRGEDLAAHAGLEPTVARRALRRIRRWALGLPAPLVNDVRTALNLEASSDGAL